MDGSIMGYLYDFQSHLNDYANLVEFELKKKYPMTSDRNSFLEQVKYINMIQEMVDEFVKEEIKLVQNKPRLVLGFYYIYIGKNFIYVKNNNIPYKIPK